MARRDAYDLTVEGIETYQIISNKVDRMFLTLDKTKELPQKGRLLQQLAKEIERCKAKLQELEQSVKEGGPANGRQNDHQLRINEFKDSVQKQEDKLGIRQRKYDRAKKEGNSANSNTGSQRGQSTYNERINSTPRQHSDRSNSNRKNFQTDDRLINM